jgi:hypothetical protein
MPDSNPNPDVCIPTSETRTATGRTHVAEGVRLRFLERIDLHYERADDPEQTISALGGQRQDFGPITAPSDAGPARQKWVYVFKRAAGGHVSLSAEGRFDTDGTFTLVDWQSKSWANEDRRPAETEKQADDPAHLALDHDPESTELFAFLVHTQLPWHRLQQYIGVNPEVPLEYRAVKIAPGDGDHVVRNGESGVDAVLLTDYVNHVDRLHQKYRAAIRKKQQYQQDTADKLLHAGLTRSVVESYLDEQYPDQRTKDESPTTPGDPLADEVPGAPLDRLSEFETEVEDSVREFDDEINRWAGWLYDGWLGSPMYETARADGVMYASDPANFGDEQTKRAEEGLCRDLELLDEAVRSDDGQAHLQERFGEKSGELGGSGAKGLAFATTFLKRLADVPADDLDDLYDSAEAGSRSKVLDTAGQRRLRAYSILLEQLEVLRMTAGPGGSVQKTYARRQVAILQPLSDAAGAEPDGAGGRSSGPTRAWTADPNGPDAHPSTSAQRASAMLTGPDGELPRSGASAEDLLGLRFATVGRTDESGATVRHLRAEAVEGRALTLRGDGTAAVVDVEGVAAAEVLETGPSADAGPAEVEVRRRRLVRGLVATGGLDADVSEGAGGRTAGGADPASGSSTSDGWISGSGRFLVVLGVMDIGLGLLDLAGKLDEVGTDDPTRAAWEAWLSAGGSAAGLGGAGLGAYEAVQNIRKAHKAGGVTGLTAATKWALYFELFAALIAGIDEAKEGDLLGMVSAGLGGASAGLLTAGMSGGTVSLGALSISSALLSGIGFALLVAAAVAWSISDTKIEAWLKQNYWSAEGTLMGGAEGRDKSGEELEDVLRHQIEELMRLMATPRVRVVILSPGDASGNRDVYPFGEDEERLGQSESGLQFWETLPTGSELRLEVQPGLFMPEAMYLELDDLVVRDRILSEKWGEGEPVLMPDARYDAHVGEGTGQKKFARSWAVGEQRVGLQSGAAQLEVEATITLRVVDEKRWGFEEEMDLAWQAEGTVGHRHQISERPEDGRLSLALLDEDGWF